MAKNWLDREKRRIKKYRLDVDHQAGNREENIFRKNHCLNFTVFFRRMEQ
ncbi:hypothetical protein J2Z49_002541 [Desulfofundulus luciae]|uniref:Uncharacterized protein n=1 Tax=Desulfofundulus luciae TaxID=74702 RepID=A0ABU0B3W9_9FIRM|nr:hypothetical protein [Desulfofundulus luciae]